MNTTGPTVVCAWCDRLMTPGTRAVSHGICVDCAREVIASLGETRPGTSQGAFRADAVGV